MGVAMQDSRALAMGLLTMLIVAGGATGSTASPLSPFRYEDQAQQHCPDDIVVWLDFQKSIYYSKRQKRYARGCPGAEASFAGRKPAATATAALSSAFGRSAASRNLPSSSHMQICGPD